MEGNRSEDGGSRNLPAVSPDASILDAMATIDRWAVAICLLMDRDGRLLGTISDGDLRRAMLAGARLEDPVRPWCTEAPKTVPSGTDRAAVLDLMQALQISQIPEVDAQGRVVRMHLLRDIIGGPELPNRAIILAGGQGTRLKSVTGDLPKPMVEVAGRPILERSVLHLVGAGISDITLAVGYGADVIESHFRDGSSFGCRIRYLRDEQPRGTAGPLRDLLDPRGSSPGVALEASESAPILVMNGDLVTAFSVEGIIDAHMRAGALVTVAVTDYLHQVPYGVIEIDGQEQVSSVVEKPTWAGSVNAGVYVLEPSILMRIPDGRAVGMTEVIEQCLAEGVPVRAWRLAERWHDVGQPSDLARARGQ